MTRLHITRVQPHSVALIVALFSLLSSLMIFIPFAFLPASIGFEATPSVAWVGLLMPLLYAVISYVMVWIVCWVYNLIAPRVGGIRIEVERE